MTDRSYLSIGDVLALLRDEFPDITISKIRFLESRGLLDPERTPSGYRKFYEADVERLRWILRQQREHFLPLKIIKGRLEGTPSPSDEPPSLFDAGGEPAPQHSASRALVGALAAARHAGSVVGAGEDEGGDPAEPDEPGAPWASRAAAGDAGRRPEERAEAYGGGGSGAAGEGRHGAEAASPAAGGRARDEGGPAHAAGDEERAGEPPAPPAAAAPVLPPAPAAADARGGDELRAAADEPGAAAAEVLDPAAEAPAGDLDVSGADGEPAAGAGERRRGGGLPPGGRRGGRGNAGALSPARAAPEEPPPSAPEVAGGGSPRGKARRARSIESGASFTPAELADASGLELADVERLEEFGLLSSRLVAGVRCYDEEGLVVARLAAGFARYGVEPRHLRTFKHAADREAGLFEQVVIPLLRQRNPEARSRATEALEELTELGSALQASLLGTALRDVTG